MIDRNRSRAQRRLQLRYIQKDDSNHKPKRNGREQVEVPCASEEDRRVLNDTKSLGAYSHQIEPLRDDQIDEVDGAHLVEDSGVPLSCNS